MFLVRRDHVAPLVAGLEPLRALARPALLAEKPLARSSRSMRGLSPRFHVRQCQTPNTIMRDH
ncbi:MAG: hypothetical protein Q7J20_12170 [Candidatus Nitrotoga sp.]|nr:hypothetical protein [Candidatus Nitrotoga sp.]MDO9448626.1 hypothetical protein [Candidatus Nitrotoga sp.]MDP3496100.1 hypothetical protein [Candidatus Nitrotoga sp.]